MITIEPPSSPLPGPNAASDGQDDDADRFEALIGRSRDVTFEDLVRSVTAARRRAAGSLEAHRNLTERGQPWQPTEGVYAYLAFHDDRLVGVAQAQLRKAGSR